MRRTATFACLLIAGVIGTSTPTVAAPPPRPNFLIVVVDDMGYSDMGAFGGEIHTPNLDALAYGGTRFTDFHASPTCSPTRAMLLTGVDHHPAGLGNMAELLTPEQKGQPGYEGRLNDQVATVAQDLEQAGYRTLLAGKWHLGTTPGSWPADRGFEQSITLLQGGDNHFAMPDGFHQTTYVENRTPIVLPRPFYSTDFFTDSIIKLFERGKDDHRPFFAYLAYTAPHWPLQAPDEAIVKYRGRYDSGYEQLRATRLARQQTLGLLPADLQPHLMVGTTPWASLTPEQRAREARIMEVYAAMVDRIDLNIGRVIKELKDTGQYENTVIIFLSDNGAAGSAYDSVGTFDASFGSWIKAHFDNSIGNIGRANSMVWYGPGWGQAATAPDFLFKIFTAEGGLRVPMIMSGPGVHPGQVTGALTHVTDIVPTILEMAHARPLEEIDGHSVHKVDGLSLVPLLTGRETEVRTPQDPLGEELFGGRSLIKGDYKALYLTSMASNVDPAVASGRWELYDIKHDPGETTDISAKQPGKLKELTAAWDAYAARNKVILPVGKPVGAVNNFLTSQSGAPAQ